MAKELLYCPNVVAALQEVRGEAVAEGVTGSAFAQAGMLYGLDDSSLNHGLVDMVAVAERSPTAVSSSRGEEPAPTPVELGMGVLLGKCIRDGDANVPRGVSFEQQPGLYRVLAQKWYELRRHHGTAIFRAFPAPHRDLATYQVDILHA